MDRHNRSRLWPDGGGNGSRINLKIRYDVHQHRPRSEMDHDIGRSAKRKSRQDDFIARSNSERGQRSVQSCGAGIDSQRIARIRVGAEIVFEALDLWSSGEPARPQSVDYFGNLVLANRRKGKRKKAVSQF